MKSGRGFSDNCAPGLFVCFFPLGLGWRWFSRILSCLPPPLSVGAGLSNRATHLWHITRFPSCRLGFRRFLTSSVSFFLLVFLCSLFTFPCIFLAPPRRGGHGDDFSLTISSCPLSLRLLFIFICVLCRLRCLVVQRCGSGFGRAASSTHVLVRGIGVSNEFLIILHIRLNQSGLVLGYCFV